MAKTNVPVKYPSVLTHEGAPAFRANKLGELRRTLNCCLLWEDNFYESGVSVAARINLLVPEVKPEDAQRLAIEARNSMKLRHAPLWVARAMLRSPEHRLLVADTLAEIIQRPDEITEFLALYWKDEGKRPLAAQVKKGIAKAFPKFDEYQLAKWNQDGAIKLRDALFLSHAKPKNEEQALLWKKLVDGTLATPDTWEVSLSAGNNKKETWERLLKEKKLGGLALLRNLRNMISASVDEALVFQALEDMRVDRILPFRFITAARYVPQWESHLESAMYKSIEGKPKLPGKTALIVDKSGSMEQAISSKSDVTRVDAANGLAILARELCESVSVYAFADDVKRIPDRRGFALRDAIQSAYVGGSTYLGRAILAANNEHYDRIVVLTDEQSWDAIPDPRSGKPGYMCNVASYEFGVGYGSWTTISGWSESILDYIMESEKPGSLD